MTYRSGGGWKQVLGIAGLCAATAMGVVAYSGRLGESPEAMIAKNAVPHRCDDPDCAICECERDWLRRNPGNRTGQLVDAAVFGYDLTVTVPEPLPADGEGPDRTPSSR